MPGRPADSSAELRRLSERVEALHDEVSALRSDMAQQWAVHTERHTRTDNGNLRERVSALEEWRVEMSALGRFVKATFGASIVGAIAATIALWEALTQAIVP